MAEGENENPNMKMTPYYDGEVLRWVTVVEYYALIGGLALSAIRREVDSDKESHTA